MLFLAVAAAVGVAGLLRRRLYLEVVVSSAIGVVDSDAAVGVLIIRRRTLSTGRRETLATAAAPAPAPAAVAVDVEGTV